MSKKQLLVLIGLFALITGLAFIQKNIDEKHFGSKAERLSTTSLALVDKIQVSKDGNSTYILQKTGSTWSSVSPVESILDSAKIEELLTRASVLEKTSLVSEKAEKQEQFQLTAKAPHLELFQNGNKVLGLYLGKNDFTNTYIRKDNEDTIYLTKGLVESALTPSLSLLRDKHLYSIATRDVAEILLKSTSGKRSFLPKDGNWEAQPSLKEEQKKLVEQIPTILSPTVVNFEEKYDKQKLQESPDIKVFIKRSNKDLKSTVFYSKKDGGNIYATLEDSSEVVKLDEQLYTLLESLSH